MSDDINQEDEGTRSGFKEYRIMTERNRQTIKNIQTIQLLKDFPHCRDYYNLMKKIKDTNNDDATARLRYMQKLLPKYRLGHVQEEDFDEHSCGDTMKTKSLGMGILNKKPSCKVPKKNIEDDLCPKISPTEKTSNERSLLLLIEKMYKYLLIIEENELRLDFLKYGSPFDESLRLDAHQMVKHIFEDEQVLLKLMTVEKGKMVVCRLAAVLERNVATKLFVLMLTTFPQNWKYVTNEQLKKAYDHLKFCVLQAQVGDIKLILEALTDSIIPTMGSNVLGISLLMVTMYQGDQLYRKAQEVSEHGGSFRELWMNSCVKIVTVLASILPQLVTPIEVYSAFCMAVLETPDHYLGKKFQEDFLKIMRVMLDSEGASYDVVDTCPV